MVVPTAKWHLALYRVIGPPRKVVISNEPEDARYQRSDHRANLMGLIAADDLRLQLLRAVASLDLPDCWIGAGFVRSAVWDHLHGRPPTPTWDDVDVVWFDERCPTREADDQMTRRLEAVEPWIAWSARNQARMHLRNGDAPYASVEDAIGRWPETATAVAMRVRDGETEILAPHGLDDLFSLTVRPTPAFRGARLAVFLNRVRQKKWLDRWPGLVVVEH